MSEVSKKSANTVECLVNMMTMEYGQKSVLMEELMEESQAIFCRKYSTVDHIFTLDASVQKLFTHNRKLHVTFIDFQKAYHGLRRPVSWRV